MLGTFDLLGQLLSGFVTVWVFYTLMPHTKPSSFGLLFQGLMCAVLIQFCVSIFEKLAYPLGTYYSFGMWTETTAFWLSIVFALCFGGVSIWFVSNKVLHEKLRLYG